MTKSKISEILKNFEQNRHPMDKAVRRRDFDFIKNNFDTTDATVLYEAIMQGATEIFEYVFPKFPEALQRKSINGIAVKGRMDYLNFALRHVSLDQNDLEPHILACRGGHFDMVKRLESLGIQKSEHSFSSALGTNNLDLIEHVYAGEDISQCSVDHTIQLDVLKFMMRHSELSLRQKEKILLLAASDGLIDVIEYLLSEPNPPSSQGALFDTAYRGDQLPTMKYLLTQAPILSHVSEDNYMAFIWAYEHNYPRFVNYLVNHHHVGPESSTEVFNAMQKDDFALYHKVKKTHSKNKLSFS